MSSSKLMKNILPLSCIATFFAVMLPACETIRTVNSTNYQGAVVENNAPQKDLTKVAEIRTKLAGQYIRQKKLDAAQRQLELALNADNNYAPAYDMMGVLLQQEGSRINLRKAESYFKKAIKLDSGFARSNHNYGVYLSYTKRYAEAIEQFEIAGSSLGYEGRTGALENLGRTYLKINNESAAIKSFIRALENNSSSLVSRIELIDLLIKANKISKATKLFQEIQFLLGDRPLSSRLMLQGAKLSHASQDLTSRQRYVQQLLSAYPLSSEAKKVKKWLRNPSAKWK